MELSKAIASMAIVLGVILAAGYAQGEATVETKPTGQERIEEREAQRRAEVLEQQKRREAYERACNKQLRTDTDFEMCRTAYKRLQMK